MKKYNAPIVPESITAPENTIYLVASGDLRLSANRICWPAQRDLEEKISNLIVQEGYQVIRAHPYDPSLGHGFIWNQRMGMDVFQTIPPDAPLIVAVAAWQYSYHVLAGLRDHKGPILTIANWSGQWPGLVGLLNLNGCLTKMGVPYSTLWSENFTDHFFIDNFRKWLKGEKIEHDSSHVRTLNWANLPEDELKLGSALAHYLKRRKAILGIFDEGCMGMYNAIIDDELLNKCGIYKERLSQSALLAAMRDVGDEEANSARRWLESKGMRFITGEDEATELTDYQICEQLKMYIAAVRIAHLFKCDAIGIQYQQGLKDMCAASDLAEGLLNNADRPPVYDIMSGEELFPGKPLPHFNEVDECAGVDTLVTNWVWTAMGLDPANTLHDLRWGKVYEIDGKEQFVWVFEISGAVPASHLIGGYKGAVSERQPPMYFPRGGGTLKGISKPGEIVWSRVFIMNGELNADIGRGTVVTLPENEIELLWSETTKQWPMMLTILHGINRNQMMARHKANHIQVAYAPDPLSADLALAAKASMLASLGINVHLCGDVKVG